MFIIRRSIRCNRYIASLGSQGSLSRFHLTVISRIGIRFASCYARNLLVSCIDSRSQYTGAVRNGQSTCGQCAVAGFYSRCIDGSRRHRTSSQTAIRAEIDILAKFHRQRAAAIRNDTDIIVGQLSGICTALNVELIVQFQCRNVPCIAAEFQTVVGGGYGLVVDKETARFRASHVSCFGCTASANGNAVGTAGIFQRKGATICASPVELDGFLVAVAAAGTQLGGVQVLEVAGQLYMEGLIVRISNDSDVVICQFFRIYGIGGISIGSGRSNGITAASDGDGFIGAPGHHVLVIGCCRAEAGIVTAEADLAGQGIELGAVDGVGAGGADKASRYVLDTVLRADTADGDDASRVAAGIGVARAIAVGFICIVRIHAGSRAVTFHGLHSQLVQVFCFIFGLNLYFCLIRCSCFIFIRGFCRRIRCCPSCGNGIRCRGSRLDISSLVTQVYRIAQCCRHIVAKDLGVGEINGRIRVGIHFVVITKNGYILDVVGHAVIRALALHRIAGTQDGNLAQGIGMAGGPACPAIDGIAAALHGDVLHHVVFDILVQGVAAASHVHTGQRIGGILIRYGSDRILIPGNATLGNSSPFTADCIAAAQAIYIVSGDRVTLTNGRGICAVGLAALTDGYCIVAGSQSFCTNGSTVIVFDCSIISQSHALVTGGSSQIADSHRTYASIAGSISGIGLCPGTDGHRVVGLSSC